MANYKDLLSEAYELADKEKYDESLAKVERARVSIRKERKSDKEEFRILVGWYDNEPLGKGWTYIALSAAKQDPDIFDAVDSAMNFARGQFELVRLSYGSEGKYLSSAAYTLYRVWNEIARRLEATGSTNASLARQAAEQMKRIGDDYERS